MYRTPRTWQQRAENQDERIADRSADYIEPNIEFLETTRLQSINHGMNPDEAMKEIMDLARANHIDFNEYQNKYGGGSDNKNAA